MAITVPAAGQMIDATVWGAPISNEVNRLTGIALGVNAVGYAPVNTLPVSAGYVYANLVLTTGSGLAVASGVTMAPTGFTVITPGLYEIFGSWLSTGGGAGGDMSLSAWKGAQNVVSGTFVSPTGGWTAGFMFGIVRCVANDVITYRASAGGAVSVDNRSTVGVKWVSQ